MAVSAHNQLRDIPEFRAPRSARTTYAVDPAFLPLRPARRRERIRPLVRRRSLAARLLHSRVMNDACSIAVAAVGLFFVLSIARMFVQ